MSALPNLSPCPFCGARLEGGPRGDTSDGAGEFFYYHPHRENGATPCIAENICVWPHNVDLWNARASAVLGPVS